MFEHPSRGLCILGLEIHCVYLRFVCNQELPDTQKSILSWIDGRAWVIQSRIIAAVQNLAAKSDKEHDPSPSQPRQKVDPLEALGHIPA